MKIIHRRCAGLDIHKKTISACIRIRVQGHKIEIHEAVFGTFTQDLERLRDWLKQYRVKQVAMESTGVYWIPVWNVLELVRLRFELILVNPHGARPARP
jgi:transposase